MVDSVGNTGRFCSLAIDAWGHPHIVYTAGDLPTEQVLRYAMSDNFDWFIEEPYPSLNIEGTPSIAVDSFARPMVAVHTSGGTGSRLMFGVNTRQGWIFERWIQCMVPARSRRWLSTTTVRRSSHITAEAATISGWLFAAIRPGSAVWSIRSTRLGSTFRWRSTRWIDRTSRTSMRIGGCSSMPCRTDLGGSWQTVDPTEGTGYYTSIAVDAERRPHISYFDAAHFDLRYASMR